MKNIRVFYLNILQFLEVKFSIYLNRQVFVMVPDIFLLFYVLHLFNMQIATSKSC